MPSALGARELLDVKASTSREMMYGSILYTDPGMPSDMEEAEAEVYVRQRAEQAEQQRRERDAVPASTGRRS